MADRQRVTEAPHPADPSEPAIADTGLTLVYTGRASARTLKKGDGKSPGYGGISRGYAFSEGQVEELPLAPEDEEFFRTYPGDEFRVRKAGE
jgi:hypothetical protein